MKAKAIRAVMGLDGKRGHAYFGNPPVKHFRMSDPGGGVPQKVTKLTGAQSSGDVIAGVDVSALRDLLRRAYGIVLPSTIDSPRDFVAHLETALGVLIHERDNDNGDVLPEDMESSGGSETQTMLSLMFPEICKAARGNRVKLLKRVRRELRIHPHLPIRFALAKMREDPTVDDTLRMMGFGRARQAPTNQPAKTRMSLTPGSAAAIAHDIMSAKNVMQPTLGGRDIHERSN